MSLKLTRTRVSMTLNSPKITEKRDRKNRKGARARQKKSRLLFLYCGEKHSANTPECLFTQDDMVFN